jgi:hypothetical protein
MEQAAMMWQRAIALAQQIGHREKAGCTKPPRPREAHFGNGAAAKRRAGSA